MWFTNQSEIRYFNALKSGGCKQFELIAFSVPLLLIHHLLKNKWCGIELTKEDTEGIKNKEFYEAFTELEYPAFYVYAALCDKRFVGWISLMYNPKIGRWKKGVIYVDELWASPNFRRKGVAQDLMKKTFDCQNETGAVEVRLYIADDNIITQELCKKCGLRITGKAVYMQSEIK